MSETSDERLFPIRFQYHKNRYAGILYDVEGKVITGMTGEPLNVFKEELKDMMVENKIRFIHHTTKEPTYAYFVLNDWQKNKFILERTEGSPTMNKTYHVYPDF